MTDVTFSIPDDPPWLAAVGEVALLHGHVDYMLKMFIKNLAGLPWQEARNHTARWSSSSLRKEVLKLGRRLPTDASRAELTALMGRHEDLSGKRHSNIHALIGKEEGDGEHVMADDTGPFGPRPSVDELNDLCDELQKLRDDLVIFLRYTIRPHTGS
jgi:hypothetical protein